MKKITTELGITSSQLEIEMKDTINDMVDCLDLIVMNQSTQGKTFKDTKCSSVDCTSKASMVVVDLTDKTQKGFCSDCLKQ